MEKKRKWLHRLMTAFCLIGGVGIFIGWIYVTWNKVPSSIRIKAGVEQEFSFALPGSGELYRENDVNSKDAVPALQMQSGSLKESQKLMLNLSRPVTFLANQEQSYRMDVKLFGIFPLKTVDVDVIQDVKLYPAGVPIGIYIRTDGILVIAEGKFEGQDNLEKEPARHLLQAGDYILKADGKEISSKADFTELVSKSEGKELILTIRRDKETFDVKVRPEKDQEGEYKLGIWIRDNAQGVGTMTFLQGDNRFGALGHGINDADTAQLMNVLSGSLYKTEIVSVKKGEGGAPGELTGIIDYNTDNKIGVIKQNTAGGIFGILQDDIVAALETEAVSIGLKQEVKLGEAQILCCVDGETVPKSYQIEITGIHFNHDNVNRGMELKVTDEKLIAQTGGIVQGMGVIDNRDNTKKPGNTGFFSSYPKNDPIIGV